MKVKPILSVLILVFVVAISNAAIVTHVYEDETVNHADYEILEIHDSLDVPPEQTTVTFINGSELQKVNCNDTSIANIYGGIFGSLVLRDSSTMNLYGGVINGGVNGIEEGTVLNVFGTNFSEYVDNGRVFLTGTWENDTDFEFYFYRMLEIPDNVMLHEIPEPASVLLLLSGILINRFKNRRF